MKKIGDSFIITKNGLDKLFLHNQIEDSSIGWIYKKKYLIQIIAIHEIEAKYLQDIANTDNYKIVIEDIIKKD